MHLFAQQGLLVVIVPRVTPDMMASFVTYVCLGIGDKGALHARVLGVASATKELMEMAIVIALKAGLMTVLLS
jgi:hypothetical protein